jgi:2',3'-cyclic-nucleotide 2'-phosphodiesterase (5'-nucleotidase family)
MRRSYVGALCVFVAACTIEEPQPDLAGQDIRLTIIHTSDIHSRLFPYNFVPNKFDQDYGLLPGGGPYGGMARITTLVKRIRESSDRSIWLDSGDAWEGAPVFNEFKGEVEIRAASLAGMQGEVLGNHEFDLGSQQLFSMIDQWSQFPHLAANYAFDDGTPQQRSLKDVVQPYQIYDIQGVKIGVIGMGNQDTLLGSFEGGNSLGFHPIDDFEVLSQYVNLLRPVCDLIVVSSHLGLDNDEGLSASMVDDPNAALAIKGVDVVLGGHLHIVTNPPKLLPNGDDSEICQHQDCSTLLVHSGAFAKYVGRIDLVLHMSDNGDNGDPEHRTRLKSFAYVNQPVYEGVPDDAEMSNMLWPYLVKLNQDINLNGVFAWVGPPATYNKGKLLRNDPTGGDSQLGNLVARSMQAQIGVEAQFAFTNSLGIRADFEPGALTNEQMFNVFPFENTIVVMYLSGQEVKDTLDFVAGKSATRGCQTQLQAAGITFDMVCRDSPDKPCNTIDPNFGTQRCVPAGTPIPAGYTDCTIANPSAGVTALNDRCGAPDPSKPDEMYCLQTACAQNIYLGDGCRDSSDKDVNPMTTKCAPLELNGLYRVAVNNYIAQGGSGFVVLKRNTSQQDTGVSLRDALTVYLSNQTQQCDGTDIRNITDTTDTQIPQRSVFDHYGPISCLDDTLEPHDGRIRPVFYQ